MNKELNKFKEILLNDWRVGYNGSIIPIELKRMIIFFYIKNEFLNNNPSSYFLNFIKENQLYTLLYWYKLLNDKIKLSLQKSKKEFLDKRIRFSINNNNIIVSNNKKIFLNNFEKKMKEYEKSNLNFFYASTDIFLLKIDYSNKNTIFLWKQKLLNLINSLENLRDSLEKFKKLEFTENTNIVVNNIFLIYFGIYFRNFNLLLSKFEYKFQIVIYKIWDLIKKISIKKIIKIDTIKLDKILDKEKFFDTKDIDVDDNIQEYNENIENNITIQFIIKFISITIMVISILLNLINLFNTKSKKKKKMKKFQFFKNFFNYVLNYNFLYLFGFIF